MKRWLIAGGMSMLAFAGSAYGTGFRINNDICMPTGLWLVRPLAKVQRGMDVTACPAMNTSLAEGAERRWVGKTAWGCRSGLEPLLKVVVAVAGDTVFVSRAGIAVNDVFIPDSAPLTTDQEGREITRVPDGEYTIAYGQVWLMGRNAKAFDSRYFGPVEVRDLIGQAYPVVTR
jgi:conjugative transfer signal peptidase TraF